MLFCKIGDYMQKISILIFLILFCSLNFPAQTKLTQEEYAVYESVLKVIYEKNRETYSNKSEFVILDETKVDLELKLPPSKNYRNLIKDFTQKNSTPGILEKRLPSGEYSEKYYLVSRTEVDELLEKGRIELEKRRAEAKLNSSSTYYFPVGEWLPFFQKYPESSGLHILSRVGFSGQFALVQVKGNHGWNGFSRNYILKKVKGEWSIITILGSVWK
jgi:hypothetical protein